MKTKAINSAIFTGFIIAILLLAFCSCKKENQVTPAQPTQTPCVSKFATLTFSFKGESIPYVMDVSWGTLQPPDYKKIFTGVNSGFSTTLDVIGCQCNGIIELPGYIFDIKSQDNSTISTITGYIILNGTDTIAIQTA